MYFDFKKHLTVFPMTNFCWFVHGRIKAKISTICAIKRQVCCMANTVQWLKNTVQLFNYSLRKQPSLLDYMDSYHSLNGLTKKFTRTIF